MRGAGIKQPAVQTFSGRRHSRPLAPRRRHSMASSCKSDVKFNFGPTTADEARVWGAARPGAPQQRCYTPDLRVTPEEVQEWVEHVKSRGGVQRVVAMLSESELATYAQPLPGAMAAAFGADSYVNVDAKAADGPARIMAALQAAKAAGETCLVHCWGGGGRTGLVQAAWLVADRGLPPEAAAEAVTSHAAAVGLSRRVDVAALLEFLTAAGLSAGGSS